MIEHSFTGFESATGEWLRENLASMVQDTWLDEQKEILFHICDELVKNGFKSNYKFLLIWLDTRKKVMQSKAKMTGKEADEWLREIFFSGVDELIRTHFDYAIDGDIPDRLRRLLDLQSILLERKRSGTRSPMPEWVDHSRDALKDYVAVDRLARLLNIKVAVRMEKSSDELIIQIENDAPILNRDLERIQKVREKFKSHIAAGTEDQFFLENMDTSGGGHGLGYPLMDTILHSLSLDPEQSLFLISASRTMILLRLPLTAP